MKYGLGIFFSAAAFIALTAAPSLTAPPRRTQKQDSGPSAKPSPKKPDPKRSQRDPLAAAAIIDAEIDAALEAEKVPASPLSDEAEFLRRVTLDVAGRIPTLEETTKFLADPNSEKRRLLIDELLDRKEFGKQFGNIWYHLLVVPNDDNRLLLSLEFQTWLADQFNANRGWDRIVYDVMTAQGDRDANPATVFWLSHVEGAKDRELKPQQIAGVAAQRFLGVQYQCAECHNHPFTSYKQTDFWGIAAFFGKTEVEHASKRETKKGAVPAVRETAPGAATIVIPDSNGKVVAAKLPDGKGASRSNRAPPLRETFADWCTSKKNKLFAQAAVNRMWGHFFGTGFVNPVDDFREGNEASHPKLLQSLANEFRDSGFDLKHLVRCICNSKSYQRTSDPAAGNEKDRRLFSHMALKQMSPDVLLDSLAVAMGQEAVSERSRKGKKGGGGGKKGPGTPKQQFIRLFDTAEERDFSVEYSHGIPQALQLMNGENSVADCPTLQKLRADRAPPEKIVDGLYLAVLSRRPTNGEAETMKGFIADRPSVAAGCADVMWVLLNGAEFVFNH